MGLTTIYTATREANFVQDEKQKAISSQTVGRMLEAATFSTKDSCLQYPHKNYPPRIPHLECDQFDKIGHSSENYRNHLKCDSVALMVIPSIYVERKRWVRIRKMQVMASPPKPTILTFRQAVPAQGHHPTTLRPTNTTSSLYSLIKPNQVAWQVKWPIL